MSAIVVKNIPIGIDFRVAVITDLESSGGFDLHKLDVLATCTFTVEEESSLTEVIAGKDEAAIKQDELFKSAVKLFSMGLTNVMIEENKDRPYSKQSFNEVTAIWEKRVEEDGNARYAESYQCRISDVRVSTIRVYDKMETAMVYEWTRPAATAAAAPAVGEQWTCQYCDSVVTGNFCCNCGSPRG